MAQRPFPRGPVDITNISGVTGGHNLSVTIRDPFGSEQVLQQPFFFATDAGLAQGLHEYSYNVGFLRRQYGIESNNYGDLAAGPSTDTRSRTSSPSDCADRPPRVFTTLVRLARISFQAGNLWRRRLGGWVMAVQAPRHRRRIVTAATISTDGADYPFFAISATLRIEPGQRTRTNQYASGSIYGPNLGTFRATYAAITSYDGPSTKLWNASYTLGMVPSEGPALALLHAHTRAPVDFNLAAFISVLL